ncbi:hypothetical protein B5V01_12110 [Mesorhizobium erdmanii]|uniref:DUF680 domain-containing protein n=3 Tax=Mesorhizobium TaxID=68287 RepID=A0A3M9XE12_9HYPH|nr:MULTISPECIES: DUF680 domain-containing protein [Mesorhizobium]RNJ45992.1 DUF680 domain-containing protein [Mesorhizobium japonicum]RXT47303.1 hypothetical protein B5V01_12110 [Mesorhizobium erdmanii]BAB53620.1 msr7957 [Mesorhizobium japonicum MAFF 303099]
MTKIALTAAAILIATGSAFAGSDNYGSDNVNQPAVTTRAGNPDNIDRSHTASIRKPVEHHGFKLTPDSVQPESGQGIWGN